MERRCVMKANQVTGARHLAASILLLGMGLASVSLVGCGSTASTAPGAVLQSQGNDDIGTLPIPVRRTGVPSPQALTGEVLTGDTVLLRWRDQPGPYLAQVELDGFVLGTISAADGQFTDRSIKSPGTHVYTVCFFRGKSSGNAAHLMLEFEAARGGDDEGRGGDDKVQSN